MDVGLEAPPKLLSRQGSGIEREHLETNLLAVTPSRAMNRPALISLASDQRRTKSTIWSRTSCGTQTPVRVPQESSQRDVLPHQFGQDLILALDLLLQLRNAFLFGLMVGARLRLEGRGTVLEELLLPAVERRRLQP
jgi:hypothetical protein